MIHIQQDLSGEASRLPSHGERTILVEAYDAAK